jgi:hypothetical protein
MSTLLYLFLAHLGIGIAFTLLIVSKAAGIKFFRFNAGLAAALVAAALAFRPAPGAVGAAAASRAALVALGVSLFCLTVYWIIAGRAWGWLRPPLAIVAALTGAGAIVMHGLSLSGEVTGGTLTAASAVSSAALLGVTCTAMILGHWYLILPSMEIRHLQRIVLFHIATLIARASVVVAVLMLAVGASIGAGVSIRRYVSSIDGIFFWQRVLFGLVIPGVLSYLTWETAKIRSTQSATGILYVDFFTVIVGEVLATYVLLSTGLAV